jgi:hypothetical protein
LGVWGCSNPTNDAITGSTYSVDFNTTIQPFGLTYAGSGNILLQSCFYIPHPNPGYVYDFKLNYTGSVESALCSSIIYDEFRFDVGDYFGTYNGGFAYTGTSYYYLNSVLQFSSNTPNDKVIYYNTPQFYPYANSCQYNIEFENAYTLGQMLFAMQSIGSSPTPTQTSTPTPTPTITPSPTPVPLFVGGGSATTNLLGYSYDGINWSASTNGNSVSFGAVYDVGYNGSIWVAGTNAAGSNVAIGYSYDGITWSGNTNAKSIFVGNPNCVAWNGSRWVAGASTGSGGALVGYSTNGITWSAATTTGITNQYVYDIASNGSLFIGACLISLNNRESLITSTDGITWSAITNSGLIVGNASSIAYDGSIWVVGGSQGISGTTSLGYSTDGINWSASTNGLSIMNLVQSIAWNGSMWVAGATSTNALAYSYDGKTWSASTNGNSIISQGHSVCWNGSKWTAGGRGTNQIAYSTDGITWSATTNASSIFYANAASVLGALASRPSPNLYPPIS